MRLNGGHADLGTVGNLAVDLGGATVPSLKVVEQNRLAAEGAFLRKIYKKNTLYFETVCALE
jgi:hypothetical protein